MKKSLALLSALTLAAPIAAFAQGTGKTGTVDMQRAFKEYNKTKEAEVKINDAKNAAKKEYDDRAEAYKKALDEINNLNKQLESPALSADKKTGMAKERDDKIANIKSMEREISDFRQTRERQLQEQLMRMREGIVKEITDVVMEKVKAKGLDFVLDKSGISINGVPVVLYAPDNVDFTNEIIETIDVPKLSRAGRYGFYKFCRKTGEFAEASAAAVFDPEAGAARIFLGSLRGVPQPLAALALEVAQHGESAASTRAVSEALEHSVGDLDAVEHAMAAAAVTRALGQVFAR